MTSAERFDVSWTPEARDVLQRAWERHGGWSRWERLRSVHLLPGTLGGALMQLQGVGRSFALPGRFEIDPRGGRARFVDFTEPGVTGVYESGGVRLERDADATILAARQPPRQGDRRTGRWRGWQPLDALYFFGYALTHYHSMPFSLGEATLLGLRRSGSGDATRDIVDLAFPATRATHSRQQSFHFDPQGLLRRHDYRADFIGSWAHGAHFWDGMETCDGIPIATRRLVRVHWGGRVWPLTALRATFDEVALQLGPSQEPLS